MAPSPHGPYWEEGMKLGYQDCRFLDPDEDHPVDRRKAAWLYAQFVISKTVISEEDPCWPDPDSRQRHPAMSPSPSAPRTWRSGRILPQPGPGPWTPTGTNVPDYPKLAQLWWQNIGDAVAGEVTVDTAMDNLARSRTRSHRIARSKAQGDNGPVMNEERPESDWLGKPGAPKAKLANEKPKGETVNYDDLIKAWREGRVK